jgi:hypothetical protein
MTTWEGFFAVLALYFIPLLLVQKKCSRSSRKKMGIEEIDSSLDKKTKKIYQMVYFDAKIQSTRGMSKMGKYFD